MRMLEEDQRGDGVEYDLEGTKIADFGSLSQSSDDWEPSDNDSTLHHPEKQAKKKTLLESFSVYQQQLKPSREVDYVEKTKRLIEQCDNLKPKTSLI